MKKILILLTSILFFCAYQSCDASESVEIEEENIDNIDEDLEEQNPGGAD